METSLTLTSNAFPPDTFRVLEVRGWEALNRPYRFEILLQGRSRELPVEDFLLQPATLTLQGPGPALVRHGVLGAMEELEDRDGHPAFRAQLVARLWTLSLDRRSRAFPGRSLPALLGGLLEEAGIPCDLEALFPEEGPPRDLVCQYGESTLAFLDRWCERLGLLYAFRQEALAETVVLLKDSRSLPGRPGVLPWDGGGSSGSPESLRSFQSRHLPPEREGPEPGRPAAPEAAGEARLDQVRAQALEGRRQILRGEGTCPSLGAGLRFTLGGHPREAWNRDYLVLSLEHEATPGGLLQRMEAIPGDRPHRPSRPTPWPRIGGSLAARVQALEGEPFIDEGGRYRIHLPFDPGGASVRVPLLQPSGGEGSGLCARLVPGSIVLLSFLEGDPDRPVIAGALPPPEPRDALRVPGALSMRTLSGDTLEMGASPAGSIDLSTEGHLALRSATSRQVTLNHRTELGLGSEARILAGSSLDLKAGPSMKATFGAVQEFTFAPGASLDLGHHVHYGKGERYSFCYQGSNLGHTWRTACLPRSPEVEALNIRIGVMGASLAAVQAAFLAAADDRARSGGTWMHSEAERAGYLTGALALSTAFSIHLQVELKRLEAIPKVAFLQATTYDDTKGAVTLGVDELRVPREQRESVKAGFAFREALDPGNPLLYRLGAPLFAGGPIKSFPPFAYSVHLTTEHGIELLSRNTALPPEDPLFPESPPARARRLERGPLVDYGYTLSAKNGHCLYMIADPADPQPAAPFHCLRLNEKEGFIIMGTQPPDPDRTRRSLTALRIHGRTLSLSRQDFDPEAPGAPEAREASGAPAPPPALETGLFLEENGDLALAVRHSVPPLMGPDLVIRNPQGEVKLEASNLKLEGDHAVLEGTRGVHLQGPGFQVDGGGRAGGTLRLDARNRLFIG